jgi:hypothetical protein
MSDTMERNSEASPTSETDDVEQLTPDERAMLGRIATSPAIEGMSDIEYAKLLTRMFKEMDEESQWLYSGLS